MKDALIRPSVDADIPAIAAIYGWHDEGRRLEVRRLARTRRLQRSLGLGDSAPAG